MWDSCWMNFPHADISLLQVLSSTEPAVLLWENGMNTVETWGFQQVEIRIVCFWVVTLSLVRAICVHISCGQRCWRWRQLESLKCRQHCPHVEDADKRECQRQLWTTMKSWNWSLPYLCIPEHGCGGAVAQVVSRRLLTASAWAWSQVRLMRDLSRTKWHWGTFSPSTLFPLPILIPPNGRYSLISLSLRVYGLDTNDVKKNANHQAQFVNWTSPPSSRPTEVHEYTARTTEYAHEMAADVHFILYYNKQLISGRIQIPLPSSVRQAIVARWTQG
jgi:hypothetical protein